MLMGEGGKSIDQLHRKADLMAAELLREEEEEAEAKKKGKGKKRKHGWRSGSGGGGQGVRRRWSRGVLLGGGGEFGRVEEEAFEVRGG